VLVARAPLARSAGGSSVRLEPRLPASTAFQQRVIASRRPFLDALSYGSGTLDRSPRATSAAMWAGDARAARRLRGLAVQAHVQTGLRSATRALDFER
jgi:hypothetical protein